MLADGVTSRAEVGNIHCCVDTVFGPSPFAPMIWTEYVYFPW